MVDGDGARAHEGCIGPRERTTVQNELCKPAGQDLCPAGSLGASCWWSRHFWSFLRRICAERDSGAALIAGSVAPWTASKPAGRRGVSVCKSGGREPYQTRVRGPRSSLVCAFVSEVECCRVRVVGTQLCMGEAWRTVRGGFQAGCSQAADGISRVLLTRRRRPRPGRSHWQKAVAGAACWHEGQEERPALWSWRLGCARRSDSKPDTTVFAHGSCKPLRGI